LIFKHANARRAADIPEEALTALTTHVEARRRELLAASIEEASKCSAELNSLIKLYEGDVRVQKGQTPDMHCLLCTDTWLGRQVGATIKAWLESRGLFVILKDDIGGLRTDDLNGFQTAMADLARWCAEELHDYKQSGYHILFNLTGGFKSIQGFLQTLAMFYADESIYIFETGAELLRLPKLPVMLGEEAHVRDYLDVFRKLSIYGELPARECAGVAETLLFRIDDTVALSAWGELVWNNAKANIYQEQLLPSPIPAIKYGDKFTQSTHKLEAHRIRIVNERIDDLAKYLLSNRQKALQRLDFKALTNNPKPPATHEIDAWADQDAKRIFLQDHGQHVTLLELTRALH
jgi:putative CRISPR-associated protein (TIGR02619 family)